MNQTLAERPRVKASVRPVEHYIDGRFQPGQAGRSFETLDPATNEPITKVAEGLAEDVDLAVRAARRAFDEGPWPRLKAMDRARYLRRIAELIESADVELAQIETLDTGMPISQARGQARRAAQNFQFFASQIDTIGSAAFQTDDFLNYTILKPVGVAGLITPWNTPFMLETWKLAPCLAAGDTCVL